MVFNKYSRSIFTLLIGSLFLGSGIFIKNNIDRKYSSVDEYVLKKFPRAIEFKFLYSGNLDLIINSKKPILVHFWATWCGPCEAELPEFVRFSQKFPDFKFIVVASKDDEVKVKKFISRLGEFGDNLYHVNDETGSLMREFGTLRLPETYFFDSNLDIVKKFVGPQEWQNEYFLSNFKYLTSHN